MLKTDFLRWFSVGVFYKTFMFSIFKNRDLGCFGVCLCNVLLSNALWIFQSSVLLQAENLFWWRWYNLPANFALKDFFRSNDKKVRCRNTWYDRESQKYEKSLRKSKIVKMQCRGLSRSIFWNLHHSGNYAACDHITAYPNKIQTEENISIEIIWEIAKYKNFSLSCFCFLYKEKNLLHDQICTGKRKIGYP